VLVLDDQLERTVVDDDDRERHAAGEVLPQASAARGRLLGPAQDAVDAELLDGQRHEVRAVVEQELRPVAEHAADVAQVPRAVVGAPAVDLHPVLGERQHHVVLRRAEVPGGDDGRPSGDQGLEQHGRLRLEVQRDADRQAVERTRVDEGRPDVGQERHVRLDPADPATALGGGDGGRLVHALSPGPSPEPRGLRRLRALAPAGAAVGAGARAGRAAGAARATEAARPLAVENRKRSSRTGRLWRAAAGASRSRSAWSPGESAPLRWYVSLAASSSRTAA
jgi:hypothetical protein